MALPSMCPWSGSHSIYLFIIFLSLNPQTAMSHFFSSFLSVHLSVFVYIMFFCLNHQFLFLSIPLSQSYLHPSVNLAALHSQYNFTSWIFVIWLILQSRSLMLLFSLINVYSANTLIISTRANRLDNYTSYIEALSPLISLFLSFIPSHCFYLSLPPLSLTLSCLLCVAFFSEQYGVFPLVTDITEVFLDCVRPCEWCGSVLLDHKYNIVATEYDDYDGNWDQKQVGRKTQQSSLHTALIAPTWSYNA